MDRKQDYTVYYDDWILPFKLPSVGGKIEPVKTISYASSTPLSIPPVGDKGETVKATIPYSSSNPLSISSVGDKGKSVKATIPYSSSNPLSLSSVGDKGKSVKATISYSSSNPLSIGDKAEPVNTIISKNSSTPLSISSVGDKAEPVKTTISNNSSTTLPKSPPAVEDEPVKTTISSTTSDPSYNANRDCKPEGGFVIEGKVKQERDEEVICLSDDSESQDIKEEVTEVKLEEQESEDEVICISDDDSQIVDSHGEGEPAKTSISNTSVTGSSDKIVQEKNPTVAEDNKLDEDVKEEKFICELCGFKAKSFRSLRLHGNKHLKKRHYRNNKMYTIIGKDKKLNEQAKEKGVICKLCGFIAKSTRSLGLHKKKHLRKPLYSNNTMYTIIGKEKKLNEDDKYLICQLCGYKAESPRSLDIHEKKQHKIPLYACQYCNFSFRKPKELITHVSQKHGSTQKFQCPHCNYGSPFQKSLRAHLVKKHIRLQKFKSKDCTKGISENLQRHLEPPSPETTTSSSRRCIFCAFETESLRELTRHVKVSHENKKEFSCKICEFKTIHARSLNNHVATRHKKVECEYAASRIENLDSHRLREPISSDPLVCFSLTSDEDSQPKSDTQSCKVMIKAQNQLPNHIKSDSVGIKICKNSVNRKLQAEPLFKSCSVDPIILESDKKTISTKGVKENTKRVRSELTDEAPVDFEKTEISSCEQFQVDSETVYPMYNLEGVPKQSLIQNIQMTRRRKQYYECPYCEFKTAYSKSFAKHLFEKHLRDGLCQCPLCPFSASREFIKIHILEHFNHNSKQKREEKTENIETPSLTLSVHLGSRVEDKPMDSEEKHIKNILYCQICSFSTKSRTRLKWHSQIHIKGNRKIKIISSKTRSPYKKPIHCPDCNFIANGSRDFKNHVKTMHENLKEHKCPECNFRTVHPGSLSNHIRTIHLEEKPYPCSECSYAAIKPSVLKVHMKKHFKNQKPAQIT